MTQKVSTGVMAAIIAVVVIVLGLLAYKVISGKSNTGPVAEDKPTAATNERMMQEYGQRGKLPQRGKTGYPGGSGYPGGGYPGGGYPGGRYPGMAYPGR